jgi:uncharacterized protein YyaL (SSP411 family)
VLLTMAQVWRERRDEALESAASVMAAIEQNESFSGRGGDLNARPGGQDCRRRAEAIRSAQWRLRLAAQVSSSGALDLLLESAMNRDNGEAAVAFARHA